jgi:hypothetical protein
MSLINLCEVALHPRCREPPYSKRDGGNNDSAPHIRPLHISRILLSHAKHEFNDLLRHRRAANALTAATIVPVPGNEFPMPSQDCFGSHDGDKLVEHFAPEDFTFDGEPPALVVVEQDALFAEILSKDPIFSQKVIDGLLLSTIDPPGEDQEQELPRLQKGFHISPNAVGKKRNIGDQPSPVKHLKNGPRGLR